MKKTWLRFIPLLILIASCVATPGTSTQASGVDELDSAIREASDELNIDVPAGNFIGIINIQSSSAALSEYIIDELIRNAVRDRNFTVVDRQRLDQIRQEQGFQYSGEVDDNRAVDIGRIIGLQTIVTGSVTPLGSRYRITIRALDVQTGAVQAQFNKNIAAGETIVALMQSSGGTTKTGGERTQAGITGGTAQAPAQPAATVPATTAPREGTYLFWPRIQAYRNGIAIEAYIYQVVVRGRYFLIYIGDKPRGPATSFLAVADGFMHGNDVLLINLDNPSRSWGFMGQSVRTSNFSEGSYINSFENVTGSRFKLEGGFSGSAVFEEIDLSKAEYEP